MVKLLSLKMLKFFLFRFNLNYYLKLLLVLPRRSHIKLSKYKNIVFVILKTFGQIFNGCRK